jgi:hypothetical protein
MDGYYSFNLSPIDPLNTIFINIAIKTEIPTAKAAMYHRTLEYAIAFSAQYSNSIAPITSVLLLY